MTKQLINLIGIVTSVAILAAGLLVFAMPFFTGAQSTWLQATGVANSNATQQTVLDTLTAQAADMEALETEVTELRERIPALAQGDDIVALAAQAASVFGSKVKSVTIGETAPFAGRGAVSGDAAEGAAAPTPVSDVSTDPAAAPGAAAAPDASTETEPDAAPAEGEAPAGPQQATVTIEFNVPNAGVAALIVDLLRTGPRLVSVSQATLTTDSTGGMLLSVVLDTFYSPEG